MEQNVRVRAVHDDGTATVIHVRESACSGDCHKCSGCGAAKETLLIRASNPIGAEKGDLVVIRSESAPVLKAAAMLYMVPMFLFFALFILGDALLSAGTLCGILGFALGIALAVVYDRKVLKKQKPTYTITGYVQGNLMHSEEKGDN